MRETLKRTVFRSSKLLHFAMTMLLFAVYYYFFIYGAKGLTVDVMRHSTMAIVYAIVVLFLFRSYNAYNVGLSRIRMLVYSQFLGDFVAAGIMYVLLAINHLRLLNPLPLLVLLAAQLVVNVLWSYLTNLLYFAMFKPRKTAIIYSDADALSRISEVHDFDRKFRVRWSIQSDEEDVFTRLSEMEGVEAVFISGISASARNGVLKYCVENSIRCYVSPRVGDVLLEGANHLELFSAPVYRVMRAAPSIEYVIIKRLIDIVAAVLGIVLCSPFMLITAIAIKVYDRGPVLYKQVRLTKDGKTFKILKFRSMRVDAEKDGVARLASENDDRITPVGKIIRACRLDELPQLFNILVGDMTIVGPRPERPEIASQYEQDLPAFRLRLQAKAGLTGLAQVYGKYNSDPYDKLRRDLMYINKMSLLEDIKLMFATVKVLFMKESTSGIAEGQTTAAKTEEKEFAVK